MLAGSPRFPEKVGNLEKSRVVLAAAVLLASAFSYCACAGWNDLVFASPQEGSELRQGENVTLTLVITNANVFDGNAAYVANVTLLPGRCVNNGVQVTVPGAVICPESNIDFACRFRLRNASQQSVYEFASLSTDESCANGTYGYAFRLEGNSEVGAGGSFSEEARVSLPSFTLRMAGPHFCGDGTCDSWHGENCSTCARDCGPCPQCAEGESRCIGDSVARCGFDLQWNLSSCAAGCTLSSSGEPECVPPCAEGEMQCVSGAVLHECVNGRYINRSCAFGCAFDECRGSCQADGCPDKCLTGIRYHSGECILSTGQCTYASEYCRQGCSQDGSACAVAVQPTPTPGGGGLEGYVAPAAALLILIIAAAAAYRFSQMRRNPPKPAKEDAPKKQ
ncbi:MAG: hypothetical protein PHF51_04390 [Candidatus ainarchaeum sp.]|nr:hypothetical protein [Candidatus ainarchaeum sp.]